MTEQGRPLMEVLASPPDADELADEMVDQVLAAVLEPDFVWVGCRTCWWPKDQNRPVVTYAQWLANTMRHMAYRCSVCSDREQRLVTVFPSAWGFPMSAAFELLPGGPVPDTLETWGDTE